MDRSLRFAAAAALLVLSGMAAAAPRVLIFQVMKPVARDVDPNLRVANLLAFEFQQAGKLEPIVWSMTDPKFRNALMSGRIKEIGDPKPTDAHAASKAIDAEYVLIVEAFREGKRCIGRVELFRNGSSTYKNEQNLTVRTETGIDFEDSVRSLARTLALRIDLEALKSLEARPPVTTPALVEGQTPVIVATPPPVIKPDHSATLKQAAEWLSAGKSAMAIVSLRDAVDAAPLDIELRTALIEALLDTNAEMAALEARGAAAALPDHPELRVMAARAWMRAGKPEEAQTDLNEAIARNPDTVETRLLLGEAAVMQIKPAAAIEHLNQVVAAKDAAYPRYLLAFSEAMLGSSTKMAAHLDAFEKLAGDEAPLAVSRRYAFTEDVLDEALQLDANEVRALIQRAIVKPDDATVVGLVDTCLKSLRARTDFAEAIRVPEVAATIHNQRLLAYKLMAQSVAGIQGFMGGGGDDALAGARIDLGDALRNASEVREAKRGK